MHEFLVLIKCFHREKNLEEKISSSDNRVNGDTKILEYWIVSYILLRKLLVISRSLL